MAWWNACTDSSKIPLKPALHLHEYIHLSHSLVYEQLGVKNRGVLPPNLVYGSTLRIPSEFIDTSHLFPNNLQPTLLCDLQKSMHEALPPPPIHHSSPTSYYPLLARQVSFMYESTITRHPYNDLIKDHTELFLYLKNFLPST